MQPGFLEVQMNSHVSSNNDVWLMRLSSEMDLSGCCSGQILRPSCQWFLRQVSLI